MHGYEFKCKRGCGGVGGTLRRSLEMVVSVGVKAGVTAGAEAVPSSGVSLGRAAAISTVAGMGTSADVNINVK